MKRSGREGLWADIPSARTRFAAEAAFLILVAAGAALAQLSALMIILLMLVAWLLVALIERASSRVQAREPAAVVEQVEPEPEAEAAPIVVEVPLPEAPPVAKPRPASGWLARRRERVKPLEAPTAPLEERPSRAHVRRLEEKAPQVELPPEFEPAATEVVAEEPEPAPPGPAVTKRPLELPGLERPEPEPVRAAAPRPAEPPPSPTPPPAPVEPPVAPPQPPPAPAFTPPAPRPPAREWNLWDLERRAREQAGDAARAEEWSALFVHLREFANTDGNLPKEFDDLIRESFAVLIQAA